MTPNYIEQLDLGEIAFFKSFVIARLAHGITLNKNHLQTLVDILLNHFEEDDFVYISDRCNDFDVNPVSYMNFKFPQQLKGIAVVAPTENKRKNAEFEKHFLKMPFEVFATLDEASVWALSLLK